jgi:hypothetical protein
LDEAAFERDREGEEEGVELRGVEPFAEVPAGRDDHQWLVGSAGLDLLDDRDAGTLAEPPFEDEWREASGA